MANIDRREFFKLVGAGGIGVGAGFMLGETIRHPVEYLVPEVIPPEEFSAGIATWYNTVCTLCPAGCGISVRTREGRAKKIEGNPAHPVNQGRLCALGQAGLQQLYNPDRLTGPLVRTGDGSGVSANFLPTSWEEGLSTVAERLGQLRAQRQGDRVYLLSQGVRGHLDRLFEQFMTQLGSEHLLHYDFAHPHTLYAANEFFFGEQNLPYYDLENCRYLLSFGADYLGTWLSPVHYGLGFGRSRQSHEARGHFVQIEPRLSLSGAAADEWVAARPGSEGLLALGLAQHIVSAGHYEGADRDDWAAALAPYSTERVADLTGVSAATLMQLAEAFAQTQPSLAIGGDGVANHSNGFDTLVAINALNYLAGNLGKPGGLVFNPASGFGAASHTRQASYRSLLELAEQARQGKIEVLILNNTNPLFTLPAAAGFKEALANIPLIVSLSSFMDDTTAQADLILPSHTYLESWGDDIPEPGVGFPIGTLAQPVVAPLYNTRATGDIILGLAHGLGLEETLPWSSMKEYLRQGWQEIYQRGPGSQSTTAESFDSFWRKVLKAGVWGEKTHRDHQPFTLAKTVIDSIDAPAAEFSGTPEAYPFVLHPYLSNSLHDGRGANLPWMQELPDPMTSVVYGSWVEINPDTARQLGVSEGDLVEVQSPHGTVVAPVYVYPAIMPDVIAMPIGQGHGEFGRYARNRGTNPLQILAPQIEPHTGSLAWGATRVKLVATGRKTELVKTGGVSRELGRNIIQTTRSHAEAVRHAGPNLIPTTEVKS